MPRDADTATGELPRRSFTSRPPAAGKGMVIESFSGGVVIASQEIGLR
jgi:hypothetical protein